ncbi:hypothetical protein R1sor_011939 [Riccia sorocarpa]|uniref:Uncharacterized protein n=1 Tax=Riccia sorocarpa TaxID=122646 RepID=A0ABD3I2E8_9MARC
MRCLSWRLLERTFLWGSNKEGQPKVPLIAWTKIQAGKKEGGLAISSFEVLGNAMRMQQVVDRLLLNASKRITNVPVTTARLKTWSRAKKALRIDWWSELPDHWTMGMYLALAEQQHWIQEEDAKIFRRAFSHLFVSYAKARTKWIEYADKCRGSEWELDIDGDLVELIDSPMKGNKPHKLVLCTKILWQIWLERNSKTYTQEEKHIPVFVAANLATETLTAQSRFTKPESTAMATLKSAIDEIRRCFPPPDEDATTIIIWRTLKGRTDTISRGQWRQHRLTSKLKTLRSEKE